MNNGMNIFKNIPESLAGELAETAAQFGNVRIERIVSEGQTSGWYDQDEDEWVCLLQGKAEITFENNKKNALKSGDTLFIPAHRKHMVSYTSKNPKCIWLCVFAEKR